MRLELPFKNFVYGKKHQFFIQSKSLKTHQINLFTFYKIKFTIYTKTSTNFFFIKNNKTCE